MEKRSETAQGNEMKTTSGMSFIRTPRHSPSNTEHILQIGVFPPLSFTSHSVGSWKHFSMGFSQPATWYCCFPQAISCQGEKQTNATAVFAKEIEKTNSRKSPLVSLPFLSLLLHTSSLFSLFPYSTPFVPSTTSLSSSQNTFLETKHSPKNKHSP